jgi:hypothetical protein
MKTLNKVTTGLALSLTLGFAATASAHPGAMGGGMGPGMMGGPQHGMQGQMQHGMPSAQGPQAAQQLMTTEERTALQDKMRNAKTPEERQQIAAATHTEVQKRAKDQGITLPEGRGPRSGFGPNAPKASSSTEHAH